MRNLICILHFGVSTLHSGATASRRLGSLLHTGRCCFAAALLAISATILCAAEYRSHPPTRPLPAPSDRPLADGPAKFVDTRAGSDEHAGSKDRPWKSLKHAVTQLAPGDTLYLREGEYFEHVAVNVSGTAGKPITIRAYPGELVVLDGGIREFETSPATAWEPFDGGAKGEYRSTKTYPDLTSRPDQTNLLGNFVDSMVPLHGYHFVGDLRSDNPYWNIGNKVGEEGYVYCGPGVWYNAETGRIHARLAHTKLPGLGADNYRGETDPRRTPLVIAAFAAGPVLTLDGVRHVRLQDLVLRGAREATLDIADAENVELDGLTIYGGSAPIRARDTVGLRMQHTACRGLAAPWTFRGSLKYRAIESRLFSASGWDPTGAAHDDFEIAYCEFTDSVDGVFLGSVHRVRFHHNLLDNVSDDGIFLTAGTGYDGVTPGGDVQIYQNHLARCLTTFAFGVGHGRQKTIAGGKQAGSGVHIFRNVFDFRRPVMYHWPTGPDGPQEISSLGRVAGDHGGPAWEPMWIYHNTILAGDPPRYDYLTDGLGKAMGRGASRRVFNNIVCQMQGMPGETLPDAAADYAADANLLWSVSDGPAYAGEIFAKFRRSPAFEQSKQRYTPGWTAHDRFADPQFVDYRPDWREAVDLRLGKSSPAIDAGIEIPKAWPDPLRDKDRGTADIGALPLDATPWRVGVHGRLDVFGRPIDDSTPVPVRWSLEPAEAVDRADATQPRALVYQGYPAFDAPLVQYGLRKKGAKVDAIERTWLDPAEFGKYNVVVIDGNFTRAKIEPDRFGEQDLPKVKAFLEQGGTLILMRERTDLFASPHGQQFLADLIGAGPRLTEFKPSLLEPEHPWLKHLGGDDPAWLEGKGFSPLRPTRGESIIGSKEGGAALYDVPVGEGRLIYVGWSIAASLPSGRLPSTLDDEAAFSQQVQILLQIIQDACGRRR